jgi:hypothetical protein
MNEKKIDILENEKPKSNSLKDRVEEQSENLNDLSIHNVNFRRCFF